MSQVGGGLGLIRVQPVPLPFRRGPVEGLGHLEWGGALAGANEGPGVVDVGGAAALFGDRFEVLHGNRAVTHFGGVYHHSIRIFLWEGLFANAQEIQGRETKPEKPSLS